MSDPQLPATVDLRAYHGDTWQQTFRLKHDTTPVDLTGATIASWAVMPGVVVPLVVTLTNPTAGQFTVSAGPAGLPSGSYTYDVEVTQASAVTTWIRGLLIVTPDITNVVPEARRSHG